MDYGYRKYFTLIFNYLIRKTNRRRQHTRILFTCILIVWLAGTAWFANASDTGEKPGL